MKNINEKKILELFHEEMKRRFGDHLKEIILYNPFLMNAIREGISL